MQQQGSDPSIPRDVPVWSRRAAASGWRQPGSLARARRPGDNAGMAAHDGRITRHEAPFLSELLERDRMFTDRLGQEARRLDLPVIEISTAMTEDRLARRVTEAFGL
jgi:hypothetical protein